ncbi:MAG: outer membrane lipoprotein-sorting protein [Myxococcota bacterium]
MERSAFAGLSRLVVGVLGLGLVLATGGVARAEDNLSPEEIIKAAFDRNVLGFSAGQATLKMEIHTPKGDIRLHDLEVQALKSAEGLARTIVRFRSPDEVAGTAFLMRQRELGPPEQYVYLPKFQKVRTVTATQLYNKLLGSDFSYIDLTPIPTDPSQVRLKRLSDVKIGGFDTYAIEATPLVPGSPYSAITAYIRKDVLVPVRLEFRGLDGRIVKVLNVKRMRMEGKSLVPIEVEMKNVVEGSQTLLKVESVNLGAGLKDEDFSAEKLGGPNGKPTNVDKAPEPTGGTQK